MSSVPEEDNIFITNGFEDWKQPTASKGLQLVNKVLRRLGMSVHVSPPVVTGTMTSVEQRINMHHLVSSVLWYEVPGDFVELGCHSGQSAVLFRRLIDHYDPTRRLHVYDSFQGLPSLAVKDGDTPFREGQLAVGTGVLLANFRRAGVEPPVIHKGWFEDTLPDELPDRIAFAHLDGDLYDSIKVSLEYVYPRLSKGAVCLVDDYSDPDLFNAIDPLPGVKRACDEFLADKPERVALLYGGYNSSIGFGSHGYFRKL